MKLWLKNNIPADMAESAGLALLLVFGHYIRLPALESILVFPVDLLRIGLDIFAAVYLLRRLRHRAERPLSRLSLIFFGVLVFWLLWGCAGAVISPYVSSAYDGFAHMSTLVWNILAVYCVYECCRSRRRAELFVKTLGLCCGAIILAAMVESFTGLHFPGSRYGDPGVYSDGSRRLPAGLFVPVPFGYTLFEGNPNNLDAMIAILLPTLFVTGGEKGWIKAIKLVLVVFGLYGMIVNDANLAIIALLAAVAVYTLLHRRGWKANGLTAALCAGMAGGLGSYVIRAVVAVKSFFWKADFVMSPEELLRCGARLEEAAAAAAGASAQLQAKSVNARWGLILDSLDMAVTTRFLGVGPRGYGWFDAFGARTKLVDPHCWPLEVLSQYGILVFLGYFLSLGWMYLRMILAQWKNRDPMYAQVIAMCTAFLLASVAPSSFLRFTYAWALPGLCLALLQQAKEE